MRPGLTHAQVRSCASAGFDNTPGNHLCRQTIGAEPVAAQIHVITQHIVNRDFSADEVMSSCSLPTTDQLSPSAPGLRGARVFPPGFSITARRGNTMAGKTRKSSDMAFHRWVQNGRPAGRRTMAIQDTCGRSATLFIPVQATGRSQAFTLSFCMIVSPVGCPSAQGA